jgi:ABC-2 type transport system permease protein
MLAFGYRMLRDKYKTFIAYSLSALGFVEMYVALFPAIHDQAGQLEQVLSSIPADVFKAMNMDPSVLSFQVLESYISSDYLSFLWPILAIIFAISMANYILVNDVERGTVETLSSLPVTRNRIFIERYLTGALLAAVFTAVSILAVIPLAGLQGVEYVAENYVTATLGALLFIWAIYSMAVLFSVYFSEKGKATMAAGGLLILMYVLNAISALNDNLKDVKYASFFNYYSGPDLLVRNTYPDYALVVLGGFAIIATILALIWFNKRDLSV